MDKKETIEEILRLKREKGAVLLAHNYQRGEVQDLADFLGDSLGLARQAAQVPEKMIVYCGVQFMAETAKILSPQKKVLLPKEEAGCPMANMVDVKELKKLKQKYPKAIVITYVNSTAEVKAESDICCTSANAVNIVQNVEADEIIFTPDRNLALYAQRFTDKKIIPWDGYCYVHNKFSQDEVVRAKNSHPDAILMVHPECTPEVIDVADEVLSTGGMVKFAAESPATKFLVGTEEGMLYRLKKENPEKEFYSAGTAKMCQGMKITQLDDVFQALKKEQYVTDVPIHIIDNAKIALERMLKYA